MERPSHIIFDNRQSFSRRAPVVAMAIGLQLGGFWLFTHGLATHLPGIIHDFVFVPTPEKTAPPVKPPEPDITKKLPVIAVVPQDFKTDSSPKSGGLVPSLPLPPDTGGATNPPEHSVRAAAGILSTHTVPPYPPIARRMGEEGKVTLRLTVSAEGHVTQADIVTSSGRQELDQTAQQWIVAHWTYKPAQNDGVAVASQVLATVTFNLANQR